MSDPAESIPPLFPVAHAQQFGSVVLHSAIVGVVAGYAAIAFDIMTSVLGEVLVGGVAGYNPPTAQGDQPFLDIMQPEFRRWVLALLPMLGGLVGGLLVLVFARDAEGGGADAAIDAYHNHQGRISGRIPVIKTLASSVTLGTGGSAGREGPIAQIGAGLGTTVANLLGLSVRERRILMAAGMAAGIGAMFRAPLAAALFSAEILYREMDMEFEVIVPSMISSIISYSVFVMVMGTGSGSLFYTPPFTFESPLELMPYTALALVVAGGAWCYVRIFVTIRKWFQGLSIPLVLKPLLGGALAGSFAFFLPEALGHGYGVAQQAIQGQAGLWLLLAVAFGKTLTTSFTVGSGQSGGVFGPAVVIGGALAAAVGLLMSPFLPDVVCPPQGAFVVVGMAGFFAAAANTPISTIIMVSEITGNYRLLVPSMWVCIIAFMLVRRSSLYVKQLKRRSDSPVHLGEMMGEVLDRLTVGGALKVDRKDPVTTVRAHAHITEIMQVFSVTHHTSFPVLTEEGRLLGVIDEKALRQAICDDAVRDVLVAADLMEKAPLLQASESLHSAMEKMVSSNIDELVVVARDDPTRVIGTLSRRDLVAAYDHQIRRDQQHRERPVTSPWNFLSRTPKPSDSSPGGDCRGTLRDRL